MAKPSIDFERAAELSAQGLHLTELAQELECSNSALARGLRQRGIPYARTPQFIPGATPEQRERDDRIAALTREGKSATQIAIIMKISERTVTRARARKGLSKSGARVATDEEKQRAREMLDDGMPYAEIGRTLGWAGTTIASWFPGEGWSNVESVLFAKMIHIENMRERRANRSRTPLRAVSWHRVARRGRAGIRVDGPSPSLAVSLSGEDTPGGMMVAW